MTCDFVLQEVAEQFSADHPSIRLDFQTASSRDAVPESLAAGSLDLGIWSPGPTWQELPLGFSQSLTATPWIRDEWILARASSDAPPRLFYHPTQSWMVSRVAALASTMGDLAISECLQLDSLEAVKSAALGHLGYALVSGMSIAKEVAHGMLEPAIRTGIPRELLLLVSQDATPMTQDVRDFFVLWWEANHDRFRSSIIAALPEVHASTRSA